MEVPDLVGLTPAEAAQALQAAGLVGVEGTRVADCPGASPGRVARQDPAAGADVLVGSQVVFQLCELAVPSLAGLSRDEAVAALEALGLVPVLTEVPSSLPVGEVIATVPPAGTQVSLGDEITVQVSDGGLVPELLGLSCQEATERLRQLGLQWRFEELPDGAGDPGQVTDQQPAAGAQRPADDVVVLHVHLSGDCPAGVDDNTGGTGGSLMIAPLPVGTRFFIV